MGVSSGSTNAKKIWGEPIDAPTLLDDGKILQYNYSFSKWELVAPSGDVSTDTIWDTKGDIAVATGSDVAIKLAVGDPIVKDGYVLTMDDTTGTGLAWTQGSKFIDGGSASENYIVVDQEIDAGGA